MVWPSQLLLAAVGPNTPAALVLGHWDGPSNPAIRRFTHTKNISATDPKQLSRHIHTMNNSTTSTFNPAALLDVSA